MHVEDLGFAAVLAVMQVAIGQGAVHVEHRQPDGGGAGEQVGGEVGEIAVGHA